MRRPSGIDAPSPTRWPRKVLAMAGLFALICFALQAWRLFSLSATYDQALFLQELWATAQGRPFESSLSSVLSGAVVVGDGLPSIDYLHLGQHANVLTVLMAPLVAVFGMWALPLLQVGLLTAAGLVLWRLADSRLPRPLAERITLAYFLSGAVIGPALENFHDLVWLPLLAFLVVGGLLDGDKEGFLRAERSLIQTIGRAARHVEGVALLYADNMTDSMAKAISETERRRAIQQTYNEKHGVVPTAAGKKASNSILSFLELSRKLKQDGPDADLVEVVGKAAKALENDPDAGLALEALPELIDQLEAKMKEAAKKLDFEEAANLRDRVKQLRQKMAGSR